MAVNIHYTKSQMNFSTFSSNIQLVLKLESSNYFPELIDFFSKSLACLHLRLKDDEYLEYDKNRLIQYTIPTEITDLSEVRKYVGDKLSRPIKETFGSIATNDKNKLFVINVSHRFCDGGFFKFLLDKFNKREYPTEIPILPRFATDIFRKEIRDSPEIPSWANDPSLFRFTPNKLNKTNNPSIYFDNYDIKMKASEFKTFDPSKNCPRNITDIMYLSHYFASAAYKNELFDKFSISTIIDLRAFLSYKPDFLSCYHCGQIVPTVSGISPNEKLIDLSKRLKNDLALQRNQHRHFSMLKTKMDPKALIPGVMPIYSAVGMMDIKRPIVDAYTGISMGCTNPSSLQTAFDQLSIFNWSVKDDERKKNDHTTQIWYNPNVFDNDEVALFSKRVKYFLKNISLDQRVGDVYEIIGCLKLL